MYLWSNCDHYKQVRKPKSLHFYGVTERCHSYLSPNKHWGLLAFLTVLQKSSQRSKSFHSKHLVHSLFAGWSLIQTFNHILKFWHRFLRNWNVRTLQNETLCQAESQVLPSPNLKTLFYLAKTFVRLAFFNLWTSRTVRAGEKRMTAGFLERWRECSNSYTFETNHVTENF